jgi:hypothetical protein
MLMVMPIMALSRGDLVLPIHLTGVLLTAWAMGTGVVCTPCWRGRPGAGPRCSGSSSGRSARSSC